MPPRLRAAWAVVVGIAMGAVAGWAIEFPVGVIVTPLLGAVYGTLHAEAVRRAGGCRSRVSPLSAATLLLGAFAGRIAVAGYLLARASVVHPPMGVLYVVVDMFTPSAIPAVTLAVAMVAAVVRGYSGRGRY